MDEVPTGESNKCRTKCRTKSIKKRSYKEENVQLKVDCLKLIDSAIRTDPIHFSNPQTNVR